MRSPLFDIGGLASTVSEHVTNAGIFLKYAVDSARQPEALPFGDAGEASSKLDDLGSITTVDAVSAWPLWMAGYQSVAMDVPMLAFFIAVGVLSIMAWYVTRTRLCGLCGLWAPKS